MDYINPPEGMGSGNRERRARSNGEAEVLKAVYQTIYELDFVPAIAVIGAQVPRRGVLGGVTLQDTKS